MLNLTNGYESLAIFVLIQIPTVFLRSKPRPVSPIPEFAAIPESPIAENELADENPMPHAQDRRRTRAKPIGPRSFMISLLVIAGIWLFFIYFEDVSGHNTGAWIARLGYAIMGFLWFGLAAGRFEDAGLFDGRLFLYVVAVPTVTLLPLILNLTNGYESLAIFVLIQIPTVFLRGKSRPEEPLPHSTGSEENEKCLHDALEGIPLSRTDEVGATYPQRKPVAFTGSSFGRAKKLPRWRQY
jgi:hypothetical protein